MSRRPAPLPDHLRGRAFGLGEAAGVSDKRLRAADLWAPAYGVRLPAGVDDLRAQLRARLCRLPEGAVYSHATAALLWKLPLPPRHAREGSVCITTPRGVRARRGKHVIGWQRDLPDSDRSTLDGIPATSLIRTFCDLGDILSSPNSSPSGMCSCRIVAGGCPPRPSPPRSSVAHVDAQGSGWRSR